MKFLGLVLFVPVFSFACYPGISQSEFVELKHEIKLLRQQNEKLLNAESFVVSATRRPDFIIRDDQPIYDHGFMNIQYTLPDGTFFWMREVSIESKCWTGVVIGQPLPLACR